MNALDLIYSEKKSSISVNKLMWALKFSEEEIRLIEEHISSVIILPETLLILAGKFKNPEAPAIKLFKILHQAMIRAELDFLTTID